MIKTLFCKVLGLPTLIYIAGAGSAFPAFAQDGGLAIEEITVTARHRAESVQDVPDSITAFGAEKIEAAGIVDIEGFINLTPNFMVRETFRSGVTFFTIRGITTGQQGYPPISYVVDGVKANAIDSINQGALVDIERIEVLKGPQSALYGAGAIAGAVNVITKGPTEEFEGRINATYGEGNDLTLKGGISGPIIEDKLAYRLTAYLKDSDGLIETTTGDDRVRFEEQTTVRGRLRFTPTDAVGLELTAAITDIEAGAISQEKFDDINLLNTFNSTTLPRRGIPGRENREFTELSAKLDVELPFASLGIIVSDLDLDQDVYGTISFDRPPVLPTDPDIMGLFGPSRGVNAGPGEIVDQYQSLVDNFDISSADIRLTSRGDQRVRWVLGAEFSDRTVINELAVGMFLGPYPGTDNPIPIQFDEKKDDVFGIYGQLNLDVTDQLELSVSGRYDENDFSTRMFDPLTGATIEQLNENGELVELLTAKNSEFTPKIQIKYSWSDDLMTFLSYGEGYRFGFFNTSDLTLPESADSFELGFKSSMLSSRLTLNGSVFFTDYSNQQSTEVISAPPFRQTSNIPQSEIKGVELEWNFLVNENFSFSGGLGFIDTEISGLDRELDSVPDGTVNLALDYNKTLNNGLQLVGRVDYRHQGEFIITRSTNTFEIHDIDIINVRAGVEGERWGGYVWGRNITDGRFATSASLFAGAFVRSYNQPSSYGVEFDYRFGAN